VLRAKLKEERSAKLKNQSAKIKVKTKQAKNTLFGWVIS
jgi:hypothetical protein